MKISIITVCYNSAATIQDTIDSVASQTYPEIEHIVVDGASRDNTMEIVRAAPSVSKYVSEPDRGIYDAMNKGIAMATGEIVGFLNADDFYADQTILAQVAEALSDPTLDACYADLVYVDQHDTGKIVRYWKSRIHVPGLFKRGWMPAHPTFFVKKKIYQRYGGFDLRFPRQADFELTMRFMEVAQIASIYIPQIWVRMRLGGVSNNSYSNILKGNLEAWRACKLHGLDVSWMFVPIKMLSRLPQFWARPDSRRI